ncbi:MAG: hypothetical protein IJO81_01445 [Clostridia bacterium]|nr:hypothetical protein [Clostridia bacterium]
MKTYIELAEEALRQRDAYIINRKKTIKKAVLSVSLVLVFAVFGGGAFIGISHLNAPETPPSVTTESESTEAPTETFADTAEPAESDTVTDTADLTEPTGSTEDTSDPAESSESGPTEQPTEEYTAPPTDTYTDTQTDAPRETDVPAEINTAESQTEPQHTEAEPPATEADTDATESEETDDTPDDTPDDTCETTKPNGNDNTNPDPGTNTNTPPATNDKDEKPKEPSELWQTETHPAVGTPVFWGSVPDVLKPPTDFGPGYTEAPSVYLKIPSKVYYSTEFDYPDFFFLKDGTGPSKLPNYCVDTANSLTAKEQTDRFIELLYGENVPFMGEFTYTKNEVVYSTWDDAVVESGLGKFIAADSDSGRIYFTIDMANPETVGGGYRDMTRTEAFEYISQSAYYKAAAELLGLSDPMVMTETHRYYSGNLYEYRFTVMESADDLETALYNYASANLEIEMRYYPDYGVVRAYFVINYPMALTQSGNSEFYSYEEQIEMLKAAFKKHGYSPSYAEHVLITFQRGRNIRPYLRYHLGYDDEDGVVRYVEIEVYFEE